MEILVQNQALLINLFKMIIFLACLVFVTIMVGYNWLYLGKILKSAERIGIHPPEHLHHLIRSTIYIPFFTAIFIIFFLMTGFY